MAPLRFLAAFALLGPLATAHALPSGSGVPPAALRLPVRLVENVGQTDTRVAFHAGGRDRQVFFTAQGPTVALAGTLDGRPARWAVRHEFVGARPGLWPEGVQRAPGTLSWFRGPRAAWRTGARSWSRIAYREAWPGIDVAWDALDAGLRSTFTLQPGADARAIRIAVQGAEALRLSPAGGLLLRTPLGELAESAPVAWQDTPRGRVPVAVSVRIEGDTFGFDVGAHDPALPLVIDPTSLVYAGFLGGDGDESGQGLAVDGDGNAYVTGWTSSSETSFPVVGGPDLSYNLGFAPFGDAFVAKVNSAGTALVWCGYIGGWDDDFGNAIAVDGLGRAYVAGHTASSEAELFPVATGPDLTYNGSSLDAWVARVAADGLSLEYCGYVGGSGHEDRASGIAVDGLSRAWVCGHTNSGTASFPETVGPDLSYGDGGLDGFVARVSADGTGLDLCGYLGGNAYDAAYDVDVDPDGNAYVTGATYSDQASFPVLVGPDLTHNGSQDAFVLRVDGATAQFAWSGFLGGAESDSGTAIAVDAAGSPRVAGTTSSDESSFPVAVGPDLTFNGGPIFNLVDAFVARVDAGGAALAWCGFLGGSGADQGNDVDLDGEGHAVVTGWTSSDESAPTPFPLASGPDLTFNGSTDAFVAKVAASGASLAYAGFVGGSGADYGNAVAVAADGDAWITGVTDSTQASFPASGGPDTTANGADDAFVARVTSDAQPPAGPTLDLALLKGSLADSAKPAKDAFHAKGTLAFNAGSPDAAFDDATDAVSLALGDLSTPVLVEIPAADPGWKEKKGKYTWKSAKGVAPRVVLVLDTGKGTFAVHVTKLDYAATPANPMQVSLVAGDDDGAQQAAWTPKKKAGAFKYP